MEKLKVALIGYGKMGKIIENVCLERGHSIHCTIDNENEWEQKSSLLDESDVAIDFSLPSSAIASINRCFDKNLPIVIGTTAWYDQLEVLSNRCYTEGCSLFYAPNFSLGMNIVFRLNQHLAQLLNGKAYRLSMNEIHHIYKLDAPSGTALQLANDLIENIDELKTWEIGSSDNASTLPIEVIREGEVNGIHEVIATSEEDIISLKHEAKGRKGFALGAVLAAEFLVGKKGVFTMSDLLNETL
ncbi:MAG: dihydrodipicolinate reductase C-terminal domain-containing protein [Ignavibacteria bacterium]|nr:dihydrodipicolinate reductase C-terminal domain-containing protein [Ignavibacteria bacterium]